MEPEPLPIILSREHGVEYLDTSLFISAPFYLSAIKWETEELAGLYPATEGLFQGNREGPCYVLAGSLENMCRGYLPLFKDANYFPLKLHTKKIKNRISLKWIYNQWSSSCQDHGPGDIYQILSHNPAGCFRSIQARGEDGAEPGHVRGIKLPSSPGVPHRRRWPGLENVAPSAQSHRITEMNMGILSFSFSLSWLPLRLGVKQKHNMTQPYIKH